MDMRKIFLLAALLLGALCAQAIPARPGRFLWTMADGSRVWLTLRGDEFDHYYMTDDGRRLVEGSDGNLVEQTAAATRRKAPLKRLTSIDGMITNYPTIGSPNALILLVEYEDTKFKTQNAQHEFDRLMNEPGYDYNGATGSAFDYFRDNSRSLFTPKFTVAGPVTLPHTMAYYGGPTAMAHDACPWEMVADGCRLLKEQHPEIDFSQFDNDGDGVVDNVFVFYAGFGQNAGASVNTVWPHAANLSWYGINVVLDGVKVDNYACTCELTGNETGPGDRCGIGTFCHEFSHVLGLPDIYSTDYSSAFTPGPYELMDTGPYNNNGNTPPFMSVYDRMILRWVNPREITAPENLSLRPMGSEYADAYIIKTITENEYFLLENRQQQSWDKFIPGHGMLVWHIDYDEEAWSKNAMNNNPSHQRIDIVEADGLRSDESRSGDPFPGRTGVTELTDYSTPAMSTWTGALVKKPLTDITEVDGIIAFKAMGGGEGVPTVRALEAEEVTPVSFRAVWEGNVSIATYAIDICYGDEVMPFLSLTKTIASLADCYIDFEGLTPGTRYSYCVRSVSGTAQSANSNVVAVTTLPPTFDMLAPVCLAPADITAEGFTARWEPLEGADTYLLDVYTKAYVEPVYDTVDFTGGIGAMPEAWETSSTSTSGVAGTFGAARPSLIFKNDLDFLVSPLYDFDLNTLSFWLKGNSLAYGSVDIQGWKGDRWVMVDNVEIAGEAQTWSGKLPAGIRAIRLIVNLVAGTLYIDDVVVGYNGAAQLNYVEGYEHLPLTATTRTIGALAPATTYYYTVTARSGSLTSLVSNEIEVSTQKVDAVRTVTGSRPAANRLVMRNRRLFIVTTDGKEIIF